MDLKLSLIILSASLLLVAEGQAEFASGSSVLYPCQGNSNIYYKHDNGQTTSKDIFYVYINGIFPAKTVFNITFILPLELNLANLGTKLSSDIRKHRVDIELLEDAKFLNFSMNTINNKIPNLASVLINNVENCIIPVTEAVGKRENFTISATHKDRSLLCGRPKIVATRLKRTIPSKQVAKPGHWPWHVALYKQSWKSSVDYICGGTLISESMILTAAQCVMESGEKLVPSALIVVLGKYNLHKKDETEQDRKANRIIVHENFNYTSLTNNIALIELNTRANFNDYIQPACLWQSDDYHRLPQKEINGTVVGWGFNENHELSKQVTQFTLPKIDDITCLKSHEYFKYKLNGKTFCAGYHNAGVSVCNGHSGGGYMVFIPDTLGDTSENASGSWHVLGIVSEAKVKINDNICDPNYYAVYTDVSMYLDWINNNI